MFGGQIQAVCFPTTPHFKLGYKLQHCSQWSKRSQPGVVFNAADSKATQQTSFDISHVCQNRDESKRTDKMREEHHKAKRSASTVKLARPRWVSAKPPAAR